MNRVDPSELTAARNVEEPEWIWRGELIKWHEAVTHVLAVGHSSVAAVYEGIKAYISDDRQTLYVFRLDDHLRRLSDSARLCRLHLEHCELVLRDAVVDLLRANNSRADTYIRPWAFPTGIHRELLVPADCSAEVAIDTWEFETNLGTSRTCRAGVTSWRRISPTMMPPQAKAVSNYHNSRFAMIEAVQNGYDCPIMLNERGTVSEGAGACLMVVRNGLVATPDLNSHILASLTRDTVIRLLGDMGIPCEEREVDRSELYLADEVFFVGTAWEVLPAVSIDGVAVAAGEPGPVTAALAAAYHDLVRGRSSRYAEWLTPVPVGSDDAEA